MRFVSKVSAVTAVVSLISCGGPDSSSPQEAASEASLSAAVVLINEFQAGSSGWVELYNPGTTPVAIGGWIVDDVANGGTAPKAIAAGTTLAAGAYLVVSYSGFNTATADDVRLLNATGTVIDSHSNFYASSSTAGLCFGRLPNGGAWSATSIPCTKGQSNGGCTVGAACDDGDACTSGEVLDANCRCNQGAAISCDDKNVCTVDVCISPGGCRHTPVADGTACGSNLVCHAGQCDASGAYIASTGVSAAFLLKGTVATPDVVMTGEVLVENGVITCVGASCAGQSRIGAPTVIETNGIVLPGLIDTHNHILFDIFDETDWWPTKTYTNHNQWPNDTRYKAMVDAKQYLNGEYGSPVSIGCEMDKYGELKGLISGTTSIVGAANPANKTCYGSLARTIDQSANELGTDKVQASTLFPSTSAADTVCTNIQTGKTDAYIIHIGEGVDATALNEFTSLHTVPTVDGCLNVHQTAIVHGVAFGDAEFASMAGSGMSLVWSPASNVFLYGNQSMDGPLPQRRPADAHDGR